MYTLGIMQITVTYFAGVEHARGQGGICSKVSEGDEIEWP